MLSLVTVTEINSSEPFSRYIVASGVPGRMTRMQTFLPNEPAKKDGPRLSEADRFIPIFSLPNALLHRKYALSA